MWKRGVLKSWKKKNPKDTKDGGHLKNTKYKKKWQGEKEARDFRKNSPV